MQCETDKATIDYEVRGEGRPILIYPDLPRMGRSVAKDGLKDQDDVLKALLPALVDDWLAHIALSEQGA